MKWYKMVEDGSCDYAIINRSTGEKEAIIARNFGCSIRWVRFVKGPTGWEEAKYACGFTSLKSVKEYYDKNVHA